MLRVNFSFFFFATFIFYSTSFFAFPELIKQGYTQCTACHVSPDGGGILTPYGRALSGEILSQWAFPGETKFLYGAFKLPKRLNIGGDIRSVQTYRDDQYSETYKFILMQADLETAIQVDKKFSVVLSGGYSDVPKASAITRRHYLMYKATDVVTLRAGKFFKVYGINTPDHIIETKRGLGWDEGSETYNIEGSLLLENYDFYATIVLGRLDKSSLELEKGLALRGAKTLGDYYKAGLSYFFGGNSFQSRHVFGPWVSLGFKKRLSLLTEVDFQKLTLKDATSTSSFGLVTYSKLSFELVRALNFFVTYEISKLDFSNSLVNRTTWGGGIQFFPRPHIELSLFYEKRIADPLIGNTQLGWMLFHYYL